MRLTETESRMVICQGLGDEKMESCLIGSVEFQFYKMRKLDNNVNTLNTTDLYT